MLIKEIMTESIKEGVVQIWGRNKGKLVRKYRCTSGTRKGRIVAQPSTCNAQKKVGSAINLKRAKNCWVAEIKVGDTWELHDIKEMGLDSAKKLCLSIMEGN